MFVPRQLVPCITRSFRTGFRSCKEERFQRCRNRFQHQQQNTLQATRPDRRQDVASSLTTMLSNELSLIPPDPIFETTKLYNADSNPKKVNLGQGTYKDAYGQPFVFPAVKEAKQRLINGNHEYLPILGLPAFRQEAKKLIFGQESEPIVNGKVCATSFQINRKQWLTEAGSHLASPLRHRLTTPSWLVPEKSRTVYEHSLRHRPFLEQPSSSVRVSWLSRGSIQIPRC